MAAALFEVEHSAVESVDARLELVDGPVDDAEGGADESTGDDEAAGVHACTFRQWSHLANCATQILWPSPLTR